MTQAAHVFTGSGLTIEKLLELSRSPRPVSIDAEAWSRIERARAIVEDQLSLGAAIYGATTGIGSQKDVAVQLAERKQFSNRMIISEATDFPGPLFPAPVTRAALVILINNVAHGRGGMRRELVEALLALYAAETMPAVRQHTSFGIADLTPMSQLSLALLGQPLGGEPALDAAVAGLVSKESLSLIDNNAFSLAAGAFCLAEAERLLDAFNLAGATALEGLRGGMQPHLPPTAGNAHAGQTRSRNALLHALAGSALFQDGEARFLQDPLSFRATTQTNGSAYEVLAWTRSLYEAEINAPCDNPIVDAETRRLLPTASMVSMLPTLSMDCLRQAIAKVAQQSNERALKLQSPPFSGLPVGLAEDGAADGGVLSINMNYIGAARMGLLTAAAAPVLLHHIGHMADGVEDVSAMTPLSITQTETVIHYAWEIAALEMAIAVWAMARRRLDPERMGRGPRAVYEALRPLLPIGTEGTQVFHMTAVIEKVRSLGIGWAV